MSIASDSRAAALCFDPSKQDLQYHPGGHPRSEARTWQRSEKAGEIVDRMTLNVEPGPVRHPFTGATRPRAGRVVFFNNRN